MVVHAEGSGLTRQDTGVDETLAALAEPTRRAVVDLLTQRPLRSSELADALSLSRPAMSRHLRVLRRAGLVTETSLDDDARAKVYRLRPESLSPLRKWLDEVEAFWGAQLASFVEHAERGSR